MASQARADRDSDSDVRVTVTVRHRTLSRIQSMMDGRALCLHTRAGPAVRFLGLETAAGGPGDSLGRLAAFKASNGVFRKTRITGKYSTPVPNDSE